MQVFDSHVDTPSQLIRLRNIGIDNRHGHVDFPKLRRGGVGGSFFALYTPAEMAPDAVLFCPVHPGGNGAGRRYALCAGDDFGRL